MGPVDRRAQPDAMKSEVCQMRTVKHQIRPKIGVCGKTRSILPGEGDEVGRPGQDFGQIRWPIYRAVVSKTNN